MKDPRQGMRFSDERKSPIRLVCAPPSWWKKLGAKQAWGHIFDDPSEPLRNWVECRWTCERPIKVASFRNLSDPRRFAVLHSSTKPAGKGVVPRWGEDRLDLVDDPRVAASDGWQLSFFDELGASGDIWGSSPDSVLNQAFGKQGYHAAYDARDWKLETVVDVSGRTYGAEP